MVCLCVVYQHGGVCVDGWVSAELCVWILCVTCDQYKAWSMSMTLSRRWDPPCLPSVKTRDTTALHTRLHTAIVKARETTTTCSQCPKHPKKQYSKTRVYVYTTVKEYSAKYDAKAPGTTCNCTHWLWRQAGQRTGPGHNRCRHLEKHKGRAAKTIVAKYYIVII